MRFPKYGILAGLTAVTVLFSYRAISTESAVDTDAFSDQWSGEYYVEPEADEDDGLETFEEKKQHYLNSKEVDEDVEVLDENGVAIPSDESDEEDALPSPMPSVIPSPTLPTRGWRVPSPIGPIRPLLPAPAPSPSAKPAPLKEQSLYYYNRGSLKNSIELEDYGKGFVKIFRDRDSKVGGRAWGTRSVIAFIKNTAEEFARLFPGHERLQIADISRKNGGKASHASHQNGLEVDIIFLRKDGKEQVAFGTHGKNGFAEQFVVRGKTVSKTVKDKNGKKRIKRSTPVSISSNFDSQTNLELLLVANRSGNVQKFFVDQVIIKELFRYAESSKRDREPEVQDMLKKLVHQVSHADHFHVRLMCQETDLKCVDKVAPPRPRKKSKKGKKSSAAVAKVAKK